MQKVKVFGFDSTKAGRDELMELINDRVQYHKDKIIDARIHEQLCELEVTPRGRIDHPVNGHDDLVMALALALYVLYRGGDIANIFGITRHQIRTDADLDEELYDIKQDAELITDKIETIDLPEVNQQLEMLNSAGGKMSYEEWMQSQATEEEAALNKILANPEGRKAYIEKYHADEAEVTASKMVNLPTDIFTNLSMEEVEANRSKAKQGNLYNQFMAVMGR